MEPSPFPVQRSLLSASALAERVLSKYDLPASPRCQFWHRSINDTCLITAEAQRWTLRFAPTGWRYYENLHTEIELLQFLHRHHITVPRPIAQRDGTTIESVNAPEGTRYGVLFTFVPDAPPNPMTERYSHAYGLAIARLHSTTDRFPAGRACFRFDYWELVSGRARLYCSTLS